MMDERKRISEMNTYKRIGREEGRDAGREEGRAEGMKKERLANATKMKELGIDIAIICQVTGLSSEDISRL